MSHKTVAAVVFSHLLLVAVSAGWAYPLDQVRAEWWTGTGAHEVLMVVDFWPGDGSANSFAFGYRFDAAELTGTQLLAAVGAANQGFSYAAVPGFVIDMWYVKDGATYHGTYDWPASYPSYWLSSDHGETWTYSSFGMDLRVLHDGDTDGWLFIPREDITSEPVTPLVYTLRGDMNCDGSFDFRDINPFVAYLSNFTAWQAMYPACPAENGDINGDGTFGQGSFGDINPFVALMQIDP